jgi:hypothetical protein
VPAPEPAPPAVSTEPEAAPEAASASAPTADEAPAAASGDEAKPTTEEAS